MVIGGNLSFFDKMDHMRQNRAAGGRVQVFVDIFVYDFHHVRDQFIPRSQAVENGMFASNAMGLVGVKKGTGL